MVAVAGGCAAWRKVHIPRNDPREPLAAQMLYPVARQGVGNT